MDNENAVENVKHLNECYEELCHIFSITENPSDIDKFFKGLFTPAELKNLSERWLLVKELHNGKTQRQVAKTYNMSLCKITRGSKEMKNEESAFLQMLSLIEKRKNNH